MNEDIKKILKIGGFMGGTFILIGLFLLITLGMFSGHNISKNKTLTTGNFPGSYPPAAMGEATELMVADRGMKMVEQPMGGAMLNQVTSIDEGVLVEDAKIIKDGNLSLRIKNIEVATGKIADITKQMGGELFSTNFYEEVAGQKSGFLTIKVPVANFEKTLAEIKKVATQVSNESTNAQDVTEQYTDLQAQLKNKKAEEESFVKILGAAGKIDDVLAATREVARVRGEIERLEGRIRFMDNQTDMSMITVNLTEDTNIVLANDSWRPWQVVKESFKELITNIQKFADGVIRFIIIGIPALVPFAILVGFLYWIARKMFKKINS